MKHQGAFVEACKYVINKDLEEKTKFIEKIANDPDKYGNPTGEELFQIIFGDYQRFADKWKDI